MSVHRTLAELEAVTAASALAITEATAAWRIVYDDGVGDNDAAAAAWEKVEELQSEWESAAWEECEALKIATRQDGHVERGMSLAVYELLALPSYEEAERQLWRIVELLRGRGYAPAGVEPWAEKARAIGKEVALIRAFVEAHHEEAAAEKELAVLRERAAASDNKQLGWSERVATAGRSAEARKVIDASPLLID